MIFQRTFSGVSSKMSMSAALWHVSITGSAARPNYWKRHK
jgi:hypothetical protein